MNKLTFRIGALAIVPLLLTGGNAITTAAQTAAPTAAATSAGTQATPPGVTFLALTGSFKVGRTEYEWVDQARDETFASVPGLKRDLMIYIWFPAKPAKQAKIAPYLDSDEMWDSLTIHGGLAGPYMDTLGFAHPGLNANVHTNAYRTNNVDPGQPSYPVLILDPSFHGSALNYASIAEDLASHGYIVIGMSHPYSTPVVYYPDGRLIIGGATGAALNEDSLVGDWVQDDTFVLNQLATFNATDPAFKGRLDLNAIGIFGHHTGGQAAVALAASDPRIKAGAGLDNLNTASPGNKPFFFSGASGDTHHMTPDQFWMYVDTFDHLNYGDFGLLTPLIPEIRHVGMNITPARGIQIVDSDLVAFFDHYLKGLPLKWPSFPETKLLDYTLSPVK